MKISHVTTLLLSTLSLFFAPVQSEAQQNQIALVSVHELNSGYLEWMHHHSDVFPPGSRTTRLMPSLDLYSPTGVSVYHGEDAATNAAFIRALPGNIAGSKAGSLRPTLEEAAEMIPEFKERHLTPSGRNQYTLFAITYADWYVCKAQNDAVDELRRRSREIGVRVIEVRIASGSGEKRTLK